MNEKSSGSSRRRFLAAAGAAAGAAAASCGTPAAPDHHGGKPFRIDVQSHMYPPPVLDFMMTRGDVPRAYKKEDTYYTITGEWHRRVRPQHMDVDAKLADMDKAGIQTTALSINDPGPERFGADAPKVARLAHDFIGDVIKAHPSRFFGLATLPLYHMDESLRELDRCVDKLGFRGILLYSNLAGRFPDEDEFRPLFRRAEEIGVPILLHPAYPTTYEAVKGRSMIAGLGLMFDTTIALGADHPRRDSRRDARGSSSSVPHVGGTLPYLIGRIDHQTQVLKARRREHQQTAQRILAANLSRRRFPHFVGHQVRLRFRWPGPLALCQRPPLGRSEPHRVQHRGAAAPCRPQAKDLRRQRQEALPLMKPKRREILYGAAAMTAG